jgi:FAD/FMN-containing dehydrogenase
MSHGPPGRMLAGTTSERTRLMLTTASTQGRVVRPGDADWDSARGTFNLLDDQRPEAIAFPADEREVAAAIADASERGLRVTAQATGHNAGPLGSLEGTLIVNTSALTGVSIDAEARRVRVGAATKWEKVTPRLSELGLAGLHGSSPDVGIVGYSLGGGIGWLARKHGMQTNAVTAIELVTAEGHLVRTDPVHEPDLFWALRGGGGSFGVVTAIEFEVLPVRELYAGALFFPVERTADVLHEWTALLPSLPEEITSWACVLHFPPLPELPDEVRGRSFMVVMAAFLGSEADGRDLLRPLRELGPGMDTFAVQPPVGLSELAMDPPDPLPYASTHDLVDELPATAIEDVAQVAGPGSSLTLVQFRHMGGALARREADAGARATLPGEIAMFGLGVVPGEAAEPTVRAELETLSAAMAPHRGGHYPNFVEEPADPSTFFDAETWERLRQVKALYDPSDLFKGNHHVPPAS